MIPALFQQTASALVRLSSHPTFWSCPQSLLRRTFTSCMSPLIFRPRAPQLGSIHQGSQCKSALLQPPSHLMFPMTTQIQTYKVRAALHKRCPACYFVRKQGRLHVECKLKPRHKQMQRMSKRNLYRDD